MAGSSSIKNKWHYKTLPRATKDALVFLSKEKWLENEGWYLAGGTALALQVGHRKSLDLDFFSTQSDFNTTELLNNLPKNDDWKTTMERKNTIYGELFGAKVSFIAYPFFIPKQNFLPYGSIKVLDKKDIAVMKITAISQRGKKRDFFDLYWCAEKIESLENIILRLKIQYPSVAHDYQHILKSLMYFEDAENDPEPIIFFEANWPKVKKFFRTEIPKITKKLIDLS